MDQILISKLKNDVIWSMQAIMINPNVDTVWPNNYISIIVNTL